MTKKYAFTTVEGTPFIVFADHVSGRIYARTFGVGGSGLTTDAALSDAMDRWRSAGRPNGIGLVTSQEWQQVPLESITI